MRKKDDTLRDTLLGLAREVAEEQGPEAINIRDIARRAGVATGTVYNYFSGKDELLLALTEDHGGSSVIRRHEEDLLLFECPARELEDADTRQALRAMEERKRLI